MKTACLALALVMAASAAVAQPRPSTLAMSCGQARGLVLSRGAIVLSTGRYTYDRYVVGQQFCEINQVIEPVWVPTADTPQCPVGYRCRDGDLEFFDD